MTRPEWDEVWMAVADTIALRSKCSRRQIGAVIVDTNNRPIAVGYNGAPAGLVTPEDSDCRAFCPRASGERTLSYDNCVTVHAETNALLFADRKDFAGGTIYVTSACCWDCGKIVANSGVSTVVMRVTEDDKHRDPERTIALLEKSGVTVVCV